MSLHRQRSPRSSRRLAGPPPTGGEPAPPHRRSVADDDGDRGVGGDRPLEAEQRVEEDAAGEERGHEHDDGAGRGGERQGRVRPGAVGRAPARCDPSRTGRRSSEPRRARRGRGTTRPADRSAAATWHADRASTTRSPSTCPFPALTRSQRTGDVVCEDRPMRQATAPAGSLWAATMPADDMRPRHTARRRPRRRRGHRRRRVHRPVDGARPRPRPIPPLRVAVLEREHVGFGASGRNGGWCSALLATSWSALAADHGRDAAVAMQRAMHATVDEVGASPPASGVGLRQGRHDHPRPHGRPARAAGRGRRGGPARSASARTTSAG